jgi:hypothetical protein
LGQLKKRERHLLQAHSCGPINTKNQQRKPKRSEQNEEKFCMKAKNKNSTSPYPVFKPVSLSDFQIGGDICGQRLHSDSSFYPLCSIRRGRMPRVP